VACICDGAYSHTTRYCASVPVQVGSSNTTGYQTVLCEYVTCVIEEAQERYTLGRLKRVKSTRVTRQLEQLSLCWFQPQRSPFICSVCMLACRTTQVTQPKEVRKLANLWPMASAVLPCQGSVLGLDMVHAARPSTGQVPLGVLRV